MIEQDKPAVCLYNRASWLDGVVYLAGASCRTDLCVSSMPYR